MYSLGKPHIDSSAQGCIEVEILTILFYMQDTPETHHQSSGPEIQQTGFTHTVTTRNTTGQERSSSEKKFFLKQHIYSLFNNDNYADSVSFLLFISQNCQFRPTIKLCFYMLFVTFYNPLFDCRYITVFLSYLFIAIKHEWLTVTKHIYIRGVPIQTVTNMKYTITKNIS